MTQKLKKTFVFLMVSKENNCEIIQLVATPSDCGNIMNGNCLVYPIFTVKCYFNLLNAIDIYYI